MTNRSQICFNAKKTSAFQYARFEMGFARPYWIIVVTWYPRYANMLIQHVIYNDLIKNDLHILLKCKLDKDQRQMMLDIIYSVKCPVFSVFGPFVLQ